MIFRGIFYYLTRFNDSVFEAFGAFLFLNSFAYILCADTNKIVETKRHNRKDDRKFGQRLIKLHPKKVCLLQLTDAVERYFSPNLLI